MNVKKEAVAFVGLIFLLLGALFGMQIMTFIFGNLGTAAQGNFNFETISVANEQGWINSSGYTLITNTLPGFSSPTITSARNATAIIGSGNFTLSSSGILTNTSTATAPGTWQNVFLNYTYVRYTSPGVVALQVNNESLQAIQTYASQSDTQFSTAAIAITLLILLALFGLFWGFFMGNKSRKRSNSYGSSNSAYGRDMEEGYA